MVNNILTELQERNKQLLEENKALKKRFDIMKMNNLTEQEIREIVCNNPLHAQERSFSFLVFSISFNVVLIN